MGNFSEYLESIENAEHRKRIQEVLDWTVQEFSQLEPKIAWNQPMFTDHGTFIIAFSTAKRHLAVAPEKNTINYFSEAIIEAGYDYTKQLVRIPWEKPVDYELLKNMIEFNIADKADCSTFWRKEN